MEFSKNTVEILKIHNIDPYRGFLPSADPLSKLPPVFKPWEELGANFSDYLNAGIIRKKVKELPIIATPVFENQAQAERAMLLLSIFAHAFVNSAPKKVNYIPACVGIPWVQVAKFLGRVPVLCHASLVLNNWRRIDPNKPVQLDNLATLFQFHGGLDESWFYLITVQIEKNGGPAIPILLDVMEYLENKQTEKAIDQLEQVILILKNMTDTLRQMYLYCEPVVFYKRIRPFLDSFVEVDYQGTSLGKQNFHGGSAAQSSLIQFFDAILGNRYDHIPKSKDYLLEMRKYMPPKHADFLHYLKSKPSFKDYIHQYLLAQEKEGEKLKAVYQKVMEALLEFRNEHLKMVSIYIMKQAKTAKAEAVGTGGTNPMKFLKSIRNRNKEQRENF